MVYLVYTTYISVDLAHQVIFHAKVGKGGIKKVVRVELERMVDWCRKLQRNQSSIFNNAVSCTPEKDI